MIEAMQQMLKGRDVGTLPSFENETLNEVSQLVAQLANDVDELNRFALAISSGDFDSMRPSRRNYIAGYLKDLHGRLMHVTWQAQQVAAGDYGQRVDFMGEFSVAFNTMVEKLSSREQQLREQIEQSSRDRERLAQANDIMFTVLDNTVEWVLVSQTGQQDMLYANNAAVNDSGDRSHNSLLEKIRAFELQSGRNASYWEIS
ncbi:hypothetical protein LJC55_03840, partial [Eubacteriales bacterium OttesenSCG-928-N14]|nr:hypothetical protein [Eubacteriales bacterium OttesenSCG-928-N14]